MIAAAKKEGKLVYYTANFAEVEQQVINAFNKRFPEIKVEMVRAPGGQLITRVKTEAAAGKLFADVIDHSDRALMMPLVDMFQDYAPPNAADYNPDAQISPKLWPRATLVWSIAYNTELVKNPPKSWMDLTKPEYDKMTSQVIAPSGGTTWTRIMFERQVLGEDYWKKQAATHPTLYPSGAPMSDSMVRGEIAMGPLLYNAIYPKQKDGAPIKIFFPPEGAPVNPYASGIPKTAAHPNAAKLFLNWNMSNEGQTFMIKELGNLTSLKVAPFYPEGFDPKVVKVWLPKFDDYVKLHARWVEDWNKTSTIASDRRLDVTMSETMTATLDVSDLRKQFSIGRPAIDGVSFAVPAGEIVVLLGPSGCGKTTTLRCVAGLEHPTAGTISIAGRVVSSPAHGILLPPRLRDIGMVFQSYAVWPHMTVRQNVVYPLKHRKIGRADAGRKVDEVLELVGLSEYADRPVVALSGGQMQRVALARSIVYRPQLLLLDEPLSNLDAKLRLRLRDDLRASSSRPA